MSRQKETGGAPPAPVNSDRLRLTAHSRAEEDVGDVRRRVLVVGVDLHRLSIGVLAEGGSGCFTGTGKGDCHKIWTSREVGARSGRIGRRR